MYVYTKLSGIKHTLKLLSQMYMGAQNIHIYIQNYHNNMLVIHVNSLNTIKQITKI